MCMLPVLGPRYLRQSSPHHYTHFKHSPSREQQPYLPFLIFEVLECQVYNFLDESIQKRVEGDLDWERKSLIVITYRT